MSKRSNIWKEWFTEPLGKVLARKLTAWWHKPLEYPWPEELNEEVQQSDSHAVCPHCFTPQEQYGWFCPECGTAAGPYNNIMPYIYIFSVGEGARAGVGNKLKWTPFNTCLLIIFGLMQYLVFAPFYWFRMYRNWKRQRAPDSSSQEIG